MECNLCFEFYDTNLRKPISIQLCNHTICEWCLERLPNNECPDCRGNILSTKVNYALINVIDQNLEVKINLQKLNIQKKLDKIEIKKSKYFQLFNSLINIKTKKEIELKQKISTEINKLIDILNIKQEKFLTKYDSISKEFDKSFSKNEDSIELELNQIKSRLCNSNDLESLNKEINLIDSFLNIDNIEKENIDYNNKYNQINNEIEDLIENINKCLEKDVIHTRNSARLTEKGSLELFKAEKIYKCK